jgi:hypothetical protein
LKEHVLKVELIEASESAPVIWRYLQDETSQYFCIVDMHGMIREERDW